MKFLRPLIPVACLLLMFLALLLPSQLRMTLDEFGGSETAAYEVYRIVVVVGVAGLIIAVPIGLLMYGLPRLLFRKHLHLWQRFSWRMLVISSVALAVGLMLGQFVKWWASVPFLAVFAFALVRFKVDGFRLMMELFRELELDRAR